MIKTPKKNVIAKILSFLTQFRVFFYILNLDEEFGSYIMFSTD